VLAAEREKVVNKNRLSNAATPLCYAWPRSADQRYHGWNSRQEIALRNPRFLRLADRRFDPKGLLSPYLYAGTGVNARLGKEAAKTAVVAFAVVWEFSPVISQASLKH
jgi:hypothetical protein